MSGESVAGVDAVFMPVRDLDRSIKWYSKALGLTVTFRDDKHGAAGLSTGNGPPGICLVRVRNHSPVQFPENEFLTGIFFNFRVSDIDAFHEKIIGLGVEAEDVFTSLDGTFRCFHFSDPDANLISIVS